MGAVTAAVLSMALTVTPTNGGPLAPSQLVINNQPGDQFDPHVDQELACYSSGVDLGVGGLLQEIRYYRFPTYQDLAVPNALPGGGRADDLLSDIDQGRIVFTRVFPDRNAIMLFDTATQVLSELAPAPASTRIGTALGGQTVAFIEYQPDGTGEVMVLDLSAVPLLPTRLTNDAISDANPDVSPDGNVVTWERCASAANCDIYRALRSGGVWQTAVVASTSFNERGPTTDGTWISFFREDMSGPTGSDIVLVPAGGGAELVLELAGEQYNPSIHGQVVVFESRGWLENPDLFVYELASNRVFQITSTPDVMESLSDVAVLPGGVVRAVWQRQGQSSLTADIHAATFAIPCAACICPSCDPPTRWDEFDWNTANWH